MEKKFNLKAAIEGCETGDSHSQARLYEHYFGYGMSIALRYSANAMEAEEILNDSFLSIFKNISQYDINYSFKTWFRKIIIHKSIDAFRKNKKFKEIHSPAELPDIPSAADFPVDVDEDDDILSVIQTLPPGYRTVFNLYIMDDYKHHEIADLLQIEVGTSKSNLSRAKAKIKEMLSSRKKCKTLKSKGYGRFL